MLALVNMNTRRSSASALQHALEIIIYTTCSYFFFGDDINFDTGIVANGEAITVYDEIDLVGKVRFGMANKYHVVNTI